MKTLRLWAFIWACVCLTTSLAGCARASGEVAVSSGESVDSADTPPPLSVSYSEEDGDATWDRDSATLIVCNGSGAAISGSGAANVSVSGRVLTVTAAGTYVLSGTLDNGQIVIDASKEDTVRLVLNGVSLTCADGAAIYGKQADKTILTLEDGTQNTITDGSAYAAAGEDDPDAALFCKDNLTINGSGSLEVTGNYAHGVFTKDDLVITGGSLTITAVSDGLRGRDSIAVSGGSITIHAGSDGIKSNNDEDTSKGWISLDGGSFDITAGNDGIQAETVLQITGGEYRIVTGGGSVNSSTSTGDGQRPGWGQWGGGPMGNTSAESAETPSAKGIKAGSALYLDGGVIEIDSSDDSLHTNGSAVVSGGTYSLSSGDDGFHADADLTIRGGEMEILKSYEGLEGASVTIEGGTVRLTASDDGVNAAGGNDSSSLGGRPGQNQFSQSSDYFIKITGGYLVVDASGDGLDSNGSITMTDGTVLINGPTNGGDGALDFDSTFEISGGLLIAAGSAGMAQAPSTSSSQNSLMITYSGTQKAGTLVTLSDDSGSVVAFAPSKDYQTMIISSPDLRQNTSYTLSSGGGSTGENSDGLYTGGTVSGGTLLTTLSLNGTVTSLSDSGEAVSGGMARPGGMGDPGGGMGDPGGGMGGDRIPGGVPPR